MWDYKMIEIKNLDPATLTKEDAQEYSKVISETPDYVILLFMFRSWELEDSLVEGGFSGSKAKKGNRPTKDESDSENDDGQTAQKGQGKGISTLINALKKHGTTVNFPNESGERLENWIRKHFAAGKVSADRAAVQTLIALCGNDMYTLHNEIEKLLCSEAATGTISQQDVLDYCCPNENYKVYELSDSLAGGDLKKVKRIYDNLVINKTDSSLLLGYLSKLYSDMLFIQTSLDEGLSPGKIAQKIKKGEWLVR
ncbi:MAG TPA: hypothetical protein DD733_00045, partial [Clostridiales bacterium]|nr:hypothetical protein [Clostridiales bacterium]